MAETAIVGENQFMTEIGSTDKVVLVDFWAEWCGPCRMLGPVLEEIAHEMAEKVTVLKVNVDEDENQALAMKYNVRSIPQVTIFKNGQQVDQFVGAIPKDQVLAYVNKHIA